MPPSITDCLALLFISLSFQSQLARISPSACCAAGLSEANCKRNAKSNADQIAFQFGNDTDRLLLGGERHFLKSKSAEGIAQKANHIAAS